MHFVHGGAYNGKANWVKQHYQLDEKRDTSYRWISAYKDEPLIEGTIGIIEEIIILEGLEQWSWQKCETKDLEDVRREFQTIFGHFQELAIRKNCQFVFIGTDISKGVVPVDPKLRRWRDATGFLYQDIVKMSSKVHYIWYGIAKKLK